MQLELLAPQNPASNSLHRLIGELTDVNVASLSPMGRMPQNNNVKRHGKPA